MKLNWLGEAKAAQAIGMVAVVAVVVSVGYVAPLVFATVWRELVDHSFEATWTHGVDVIIGLNAVRWTLGREIKVESIIKPLGGGK